MQPFEYIVVLASLILGLGIAQILTGVADIVSNLRNVKLSLPHGLLVVVVFLIHIQEWWFNYQYSIDVKEWTLAVVLAVIVFPILLFLQARMLFPTGLRSHEADLNEYYFDQWPLLFVVGMSTVLVSIMQNIFLSGIGIGDQLHLVAYALIYLFFVMFRVKNPVAHIVFLALQIMAFVIYIVTDDAVLKTG